MAESYNRDKFDKSGDMDEIKKDIEDAESDNGDFPDIPDGTYEISVKQMTMRTQIMTDDFF